MLDKSSKPTTPRLVKTPVIERFKKNAFKVMKLIARARRKHSKKFKLIDLIMQYKLQQDTELSQSNQLGQGSENGDRSQEE